MNPAEQIDCALSTRRAAQRSHRFLACPYPCPVCGRYIHRGEGPVYFHGKRHHAACFLDAARAARGDR